MVAWEIFLKEIYSPDQKIKYRNVVNEVENEVVSISRNTICRGLSYLYIASIVCTASDSTQYQLDHTHWLRTPLNMNSMHNASDNLHQFKKKWSVKKTITHLLS